MLQDIFDKIDSDIQLSKDEVAFLLLLEDKSSLNELYNKADMIRKRYVGDDIHLRGLIEFSNFCTKNCRYCGIRRGNKKLKRYRMSIEEILSTVYNAEKSGYRTVVLQSGEDKYYTIDRLEMLVKGIKKQVDIAVTLSIGERPREEYERLYSAGTDRFLLRFETSNRNLYAELHPDSYYDERFQVLLWLKEIGYQVGSGIMIGIPGQTVYDLADDILKFKELELDMIGMGPYICHEDTPLAGSKNGSVEMTFKVIAVTRIITKDTHIPATTALATLRPEDGREKALQLGANVIMPNVTPAVYRAFYELYPNKVCMTEDSQQYTDYIRSSLNSIGRAISCGYGHSLKHSKNI